MPAPWSAETRATGAAGLSAAVWELDLATGELMWSPGMHRLAGSRPEAVRPSMSWWVSLVVPADRARVRASIVVVRESGRGTQERFTMVGVDGVERTVEAWTEVEADADGAPVRLFGAAVDVSGSRTGAPRDELTGLLSRTALTTRLGASLAAGSVLGPVGVVLAGLDRFSVVTDAYGRATGDALLTSFAARLRAVVPPGAVLARLDGDVFGIVVEGAAAGADALSALATQVLGVARRPHVLGDRADPLTVSTSVGTALSDGSDPAAGLEAEELLRRASVALGQAKREGRDRARAYDGALGEAALARVRTEAVLRSALDAGRLQVLYQPVVDLASGEVAGVEALGRIVDPVLGALSPAVFVGVSEETGLVVRLDEWVLGRASAMVARWRPPAMPVPAARAGGLSLHGAATGAPDPRTAGGAAGGTPGEPAGGTAGTTSSLGPTVAVNMSSRTLARPDLATLVRGALRLSGDGPPRLLVEITEHSLLDQGETARDTLDGLQRLGVGVGIDDFGTGWSALSYLSVLDLAFMKIDRCFVSRLGIDASAGAVVQAVIDLAHAHRLRVVAEGVETEDQARRLAAMGCDHGQGWWFGRPMAEADLDDAVRTWYARALSVGFGVFAAPGGAARPAAHATAPAPAMDRVLTLLR